MQWSYVTKTQTLKTLRQFGLLSLVVFGGGAAWRAYTDASDRRRWLSARWAVYWDCWG